jgi:hypothetical protein
MGRLLSVLVASAVALSGGSAGLAGAPPPIIPGVGIDGVRLGMSQAAVRSVLGAPMKVATATGCCGPIREFDYAKLGLVVSFLGSPFRHVSWVTTTSPVFRTATGAHVGSTKTELQNDVGGVQCGGGNTADNVCTLHRGSADQTSFSLRGGRVVTVIIGLIPE